MAEGGGLAGEREDEALKEEEEDIFILGTDHGSKHHTEEGQGEEEGLENIEERGPILLGEGNGERWKIGRGVLTRVKAEDDDEEVVEEKEKKRELLMPTNWEWEDGERDEESEELSSPSGMPGTTPPAGSRYMKHARKGHKYKGGKKMSLGHIPKRRYRDTLQRRPQSMVALQTPRREGEEGKGRGRRNTAPTINTGKTRRQSRQGAGGGGRRKRSGATGEGTSPHHVVAGDDRSLQRRKKRNQQRIAQDRDKKATQNPSSPLTLQPTPQPPSPNPLRHRPPLIPVQSVDIPDYTPSLHLHDNSPTDPLTSSLNFLPPLRSSSAGINGIAEETSDRFHLALPLGRVYRSYSDAHVTVPTGFSRNLGQQERREGAVCPLDRKQFFKRFQKALKYAAGISRPQPQPAETPFHPHMSRYHSENLGLENPRGMYVMYKISFS